MQVPLLKKVDLEEQELEEDFQKNKLSDFQLSVK
jgi:hypothetical protein